MSRAQYSNERYTLAFGVDHTPMGPFVQVWDMNFPNEETDQPTVDIDSLFGVRYNLEALKTNRILENLVQSIKKRYLSFLKEQRQYPHMSEDGVVGIAKALGLHSPALERKVYELWD